MGRPGYTFGHSEKPRNAAMRNTGRGLLCFSTTACFISVVCALHDCSDYKTISDGGLAEVCAPRMLFTAQCTLVQMRGLGIACRLSVRPSVTLVICDHIGWNSSKIISRLISVGILLSVDPNSMDLL